MSELTPSAVLVRDAGSLICLDIAAGEHLTVALTEAQARLLRDDLTKRLHKLGKRKQQRRQAHRQSDVPMSGTERYRKDIHE
jgi:hypothetical protein